MEQSGWQKQRKDEGPEIEAFLKAREPRYVSACARYLQRQTAKRPAHEHLWTLRNDEGTLSALLIHSRRSLLPVFNGKAIVPLPRFLNRFLGKMPIHAVQGLRQEVELLTNAMDALGYTAAEDIDYDLMSLDREPDRRALNAGPGELILRKPDSMDIGNLYPLQAAYEQEEVLPRDVPFNSVSCRLTLEHIVGQERILAAELDGLIVGKINTNAASFTRSQIGGIYVHPAYRGRGIAAAMIAAFARDLIHDGRGVTLFVKKRNIAAHAVYRRVGFETTGDYRISYY
jgi:ribosomal protein S18 acetylase RimI-like enzyme